MTGPADHSRFATALMQIDLDVAAPIIIAQAPVSTRRCMPIVGGRVSGGYQGAVLGGGGDWQDIGPDGKIEINARYVLDLGGGLVEVESRGLRAGPPEVLERLARGEFVDPEDYYFRTAMRFWTTSPELSRLNNILAVSRGERLANVVKLTVYEVA